MRINRMIANKTNFLQNVIARSKRRSNLQFEIARVTFGNSATTIVKVV
jgi:hypothetical protein